MLSPLLATEKKYLFLKNWQTSKSCFLGQKELH